MGRAKNHDQRKGQWLVNKIRSNPKYKKHYTDAIDDHNSEQALVERIIFSIENDEFDEYMEDYNK